MTTAQVRWIAALPEAEFQKCVIDQAHSLGWLVCHYRPARTSRGYRTPLEGDAGCPDLILARNGRVLLVELKTVTGSPTPAQRKWLTAAAGNGRLWKPTMWPQILADLHEAA